MSDAGALIFCLKNPQPMPTPEADRESLLANIAIVLVEPKYPENIGAAARCALNMGISRLIVVRRTPPELDRMLTMATHHAAHLIHGMVLVDDLAAALRGFSWIIGTTARQGRQRRNMRSPRKVAAELAPLLKNNQAALLFGAEDRGLTNDHLKFCNRVTTIPTAGFSSLNLAQAVAVLCYEVYVALLGMNGSARDFAPQLAASHELETMYNHIEEMLLQVGFLKPGDQAYWMRSIRSFLGRLGLQAKEVRIVRGFCRQLLGHTVELRHDQREK